MIHRFTIQAGCFCAMLKAALVALIALGIATVTAAPLSNAAESGVSRYCGAVLYNRFNNVSDIVNCDFMSTASWPTQTIIVNNVPVVASFPTGRLRLSFFGTYPMPPFATVLPIGDDRNDVVASDPAIMQAPDYLTDFNGFNLRNYWFNTSMVGRKFPDMLTFSIPWCAANLDYATPYSGNATIQQLYPPDYPVWSNPSDTTLPECRTPLLFNYRPIGGSTAAQRFDTHCNGTFSQTCLQSPRLNFGTGRPSVPNDPFYLTRPELAELNNYPSYALNPKVSRWGRNYYDVPPDSIGNFWGRGIARDQGDDIVGTYTWIRPPNCTMELYTSQNKTPIINFDFEGLYDQQDGAPVLIEWDSNTPAANASRPWMNRVSFMPGLSCFALNPRPASALRFSESNVALVTGICRATAPWNATKYSSSLDQFAYLTLTGGVTQPSSIAPNTVAVQIAVYNLPSDGMSVYTTVDAVQYAPNGTMDPIVLRVSNNLFLQNGKISQFTVDYTQIAGSFQNVWDLFLTVFAPDNTPILSLRLPEDNSIPPCACRPSADVLDGNVICDTDFKVIEDTIITNPLFVPGQTTVRPNCTIVLTSVQGSFIRGNSTIEQNSLYQLNLNINGSSDNGYIVGWNVMNNGALSVQIDTPEGQTAQFRAFGEGQFTIQAAVTVPVSLLKGTCFVDIQVFRTCVTPAIAAGTTDADLNQLVTLDATVTLIPSGNVYYDYSWTIDNAVPLSSLGSASITNAAASVIWFSASSTALYTLKLQLDTYDVTSLSLLCVQYRYIDIAVSNKTLPPIDPGVADTVVIPDVCFENIGNFTKPIPPTGEYINGLPPTDPVNFQPIGSVNFAQDDSWKLTKLVRNLARMNFSEEDEGVRMKKAESENLAVQIAYTAIRVIVGIFGTALGILVSVSLYTLLPLSAQEKLRTCCSRKSCKKCKRCKPCCGKPCCGKKKHRNQK